MKTIANVYTDLKSALVAPLLSPSNHADEGSVRALSSRPFDKLRVGSADTSEVRALSIRQPYAELILRGIKTIEYRSRPTRIVDERFWIYASKTPAKRPIWSRDLSLGDPPAWMIRADELLPTGVIVGSAIIDRLEREASRVADRRDRPAASTLYSPLPTLH
jgi:hypothetical protein